MIHRRSAKLTLLIAAGIALSTLSATTAQAEPQYPTGCRSATGVNQWWNEVRAWCTGGQGQVRAVAVCRDGGTTWTQYGAWKYVPNTAEPYWSTTACPPNIPVDSHSYQTSRL
ncbi:hypothetical protein Ntsu_42030 [Nocardia sp. IFM 10818]